MLIANGRLRLTVLDCNARNIQHRYFVAIRFYIIEIDRFSASASGFFFFSLHSPDPSLSIGFNSKSIKKTLILHAISKRINQTEYVELLRF